MKPSPSEKLEIIRLVEDSHLPARRTLETLGIARSNFYRWYDRYQRGGPEALADRPSRPDRVWNRIPDAVREQIIEMALDVRSSRHANWRFGLRMSGAILCLRLPCIAF
jgi:putative transposase